MMAVQRVVATEGQPDEVCMIVPYTWTNFCAMPADASLMPLSLTHTHTRTLQLICRATRGNLAVFGMEVALETYFRTLYLRHVFQRQHEKKQM